MNFWLLAAAGLASATCGLHVIAGGREAARPLLASLDLDRVAKYTNYYCWHLVTITIAALAIAFATAAFPATSQSLAVFATGASFAFALLNLVMIARFRLPLREFGQWVLFLAIALLGLTGLLT